MIFEDIVTQLQRKRKGVSVGAETVEYVITDEGTQSDPITDRFKNPVHVKKERK